MLQVKISLKVPLKEFQKFLWAQPFLPPAFSLGLAQFPFPLLRLSRSKMPLPPPAHWMRSTTHPRRTSPSHPGSSTPAFVVLAAYQRPRLRDCSLTQSHPLSFPPRLHAPPAPLHRATPWVFAPHSEPTLTLLYPPGYKRTRASPLPPFPTCGPPLFSVAQNH